MTSTELKIGISTNSRPSSRVLKPPGGGHSNIFSEPEVAVNAPRPKYNQQNSSNVNACMGSTDPNQAVEKLRVEITNQKEDNTKEQNSNQQSAVAAKSSANANDGPRGRIPPGGHSSGGFW